LTLFPLANVVLFSGAYWMMEITTQMHTERKRETKFSSRRMHFHFIHCQVRDWAISHAIYNSLLFKSF